MVARERLSLQEFCDREVAWLGEAREEENGAEWGLHKSQGYANCLGVMVSLLEMRIQCDLVLL